MRTFLTLICGLLLVASCGVPARRERRKAPVVDATQMPDPGNSTYVYGSKGPGVTPADPAAVKPGTGTGKPAAAKPGATKPTAGPSAGTPSGTGTGTGTGTEAPSGKGARITAQILTTRSVPAQYTVAVAAHVPTGGYDFGIDHSRFDGDVLTLYLDLKEPKRDAVVTQALQTLTAKYVSGRRVVSSVRVFVNVVRSNGSHSGFKLVETAK